MNWTLLVRGGTVVDGTGAPPVVADVAVEGERIAAVGAGLPGEGVPTIDASDKLVAPGFIDIHFALRLLPVRLPVGGVEGSTGRDHGGGGNVRFLARPARPPRDATRWNE